MSGAQDSLALARDLAAQLSLVDDELDASESDYFSLIGPPSVGGARNPMSLRSTTRVTRGAGSGEDDLSSVGRRPPLGGGSRALGMSNSRAFARDLADQLSLMEIEFNSLESDSYSLLEPPSMADAGNRTSLRSAPWNYQARYPVS